MDIDVEMDVNMDMAIEWMWIWIWYGMDMDMDVDTFIKPSGRRSHTRWKYFACNQDPKNANKSSKYLSGSSIIICDLFVFPKNS